MKIREITDVIEAFAPLSAQESYDNSGLIVGDPQAEAESALLCGGAGVRLDCAAGKKRLRESVL